MTVERMSPRQCLAKIESEGYSYLDVRTEAEFEGGHPSGAYNVPVMLNLGGGMQPNPDFVAVVSRAFAKDAKLVVGCQAGARSQRATAALTAAGFTDLIDQRAGWGGARDPYGRVSEQGWAGEGLPAATGPDAARGYRALKG